MKRANFGTRMAALAIDVVGVAIVAIIFENPILKLADALGMIKFLSIDTSAEALMMVILAFWGAGLLYMLTDVVAAATPGKMFMRLKIRREDGRKTGIGNLLKRYLLKCSFLLIILPFGIVENTILSILFLSIGLIGFVGYFLILGGERQALHDRLSHTSVFRS
ncbi:MAG: RDD family protein [Candidatus Aminicenantes bacterium]|nr:RDD family protein [Candidatus Aminicenantes bacterium]